MSILAFRGYLELGVGTVSVSITLPQQLPELDITAVDLSPDMAVFAREFILEKKQKDRTHYIPVILEMNDLWKSWPPLTWYIHPFPFITGRNLKNLSSIYGRQFVPAVHYAS